MKRPDVPNIAAEFFEHQDVLKRVLFDDYSDEKSSPNLDLRMRLQIDVPTSPVRKVFKGGDYNNSEDMIIKNYHILNEVVMDRGPSPYAI